MLPLNLNHRLYWSLYQMIIKKMYRRKLYFLTFRKIQIRFSNKERLQGFYRSLSAGNKIPESPCNARSTVQNDSPKTSLNKK